MSETTRVCLDAGMRYPWPACDRNADRPPILPFAGWCLLPRSAQCGRCVNFVGLGSRMVGKQPPSMSATRSHILSVSLFCAGLHGSLDATLRALLAQYLAGDDSAGSIALDLAEERGYDTRPGCCRWYAWSGRPCGVFEHEATISPPWDACPSCGGPLRRGENARRACVDEACGGRPGFDCAEPDCLRYRNHDGPHRLQIAGHRADAMFVDDPHAPN